MWSLTPTEFGDLPDWECDDHDQALEAFKRLTLKPVDEHYRTGAFGIDASWYVPLIERAAQAEAIVKPKDFFEQNFTCYKISEDSGKRGQVTGFYEPEVAARRQRSGTFQTPILAKPADLMPLDEKNRPAEMDASYRFGRLCADGKITAYFERAEIEAGSIDNVAQVIAFVEDPVDAFFIHIQGAARLKLADGATIRITYDGKSGQPFTAIGKLLIQRGEISKADISMQSIRAWLRAHPDDACGLMQENRSYIFFKEMAIGDENLGPVAAAKVPLTPMRSLAVDRLLHTFSTPIFVSADRVNNARFNHLMIAQETGTAIVGAARGDIFFGSGDAAGDAAGSVNSACDFYILVPRDARFDTSKVALP